MRAPVPFAAHSPGPRSLRQKVKLSKFARSGWSIAIGMAAKAPGRHLIALGKLGPVRARTMRESHFGLTKDNNSGTIRRGRASEGAPFAVGDDR